LTILLIPTLECQLKCLYCFESRLPRIPLNVDAMVSTLELLQKEKSTRHSSIALFGGEASLTPLAQMEKLIQNAEKFTNNPLSIQTNGFALDEKMVDLFAKHNVRVGVSIDGSSELNILRGTNPRSKKSTKKYNQKLNENLHVLHDEKIHLSVISVLHRANVGSSKRLKKFKEWLLQIRDLGITGGRLNPMFSDKAKQYELSPRRLTEVWIDLYNFCKNNNLVYYPLKEMVNNLKGKNVSPCSFGGCDPLATRTVSILPDGTLGNCDRTFGLGIIPRIQQTNRIWRTEALKLTQCRNCKFFNICHGGCPMEGNHGDFRNKTRFCKTIYDVYSYLQKELQYLGIETFDQKKEDSYQHQDGAYFHADKPHGDSYNE